MDWTLFVISAVLWAFFFEHFIWQKRLEAMKEIGLQAPSAFTTASKIFEGITFLSLLSFLVLYGIKVSWLWSCVIVLGGYAAALAYTILTNKFRGTFAHKISWLGMPALNVFLWLRAF